MMRQKHDYMSCFFVFLNLMIKLYNFPFATYWVCEYMVMHCIMWYLQLHSLLPLGSNSGIVSTRTCKGGSHVI